jgi:hypothetical protein
MPTPKQMETLAAAAAVRGNVPSEMRQGGPTPGGDTATIGLAAAASSNRTLSEMAPTQTFGFSTAIFGEKQPQMSGKNDYFR